MEYSGAIALFVIILLPLLPALLHLAVNVVERSSERLRRSVRKQGNGISLDH
ncbi:MULTISPECIES: hypothetical protein [unclassified Mycobacterium]|uniref:hypothetical protein n=1 Tax=unclassified Mycobacterium TaxID=2642494 RepID=UPI000AF51FEB|nr:MULTISPECIES: hypothetical protein [unclassified Mycobacterium]